MRRLAWNECAKQPWGQPWGENVKQPWRAAETALGHNAGTYSKWGFSTDSIAANHRGPDLTSVAMRVATMSRCQYARTAVSCVHLQRRWLDDVHTLITPSLPPKRKNLSTVGAIRRSCGVHQQAFAVSRSDSVHVPLREPQRPRRPHTSQIRAASSYHSPVDLVGRTGTSQACIRSLQYHEKGGRRPVRGDVPSGLDTAQLISDPISPANC